jgi:hypothetical protein
MAASAQACAAGSAGLCHYLERDYADENVSGGFDWTPALALLK